MVPVNSGESAGREGLRVRDDELDYDDELIYTFRGGRFTGIGYEDVPGRGVSEVSYQDGLQDGPARDWYPSGVLKGESIYRRNLLHGHVREFRENGTLILDKEYEYGILVRGVEYNDSGDMISSSSLTEDSPNYSRLQRLRERFSSD